MQNAKSFLENLHFAILILHFSIPLQRNKHEARHLFLIVQIPAFSSAQAELAALVESGSSR